MILQYIDAHGRIARSEVCELCKINKDRAYRLLNKMREEGVIVLGGETKKNSHYIRMKK